MVRVIFEAEVKFKGGRVGGRVKWARFHALHRYNQDHHIQHLYRSDEMNVRIT
jgi:hypothetical protein